jgi:hypothetical protein
MGINNEQLNIKNLATGIYSLRIQTNNSKTLDTMKQVIKSHIVSIL